MVDINNFIISLKLSWLQKLFKDVSPPWKIFATETINFKGIFILGAPLVKNNVKVSA